MNVSAEDKLFTFVNDDADDDEEVNDVAVFGSVHFNFKLLYDADDNSKFGGVGGRLNVVARTDDEYGPAATSFNAWTRNLNEQNVF